MLTTHLLQLQCIIKLPLADFPVRPGQHERRGRHQPKDASEDQVDLECEEEEREQRKAPHQQVQGDAGIEGWGRGSRRVCIRSIGSAELKRGQLEDAEGEPEDIEEGHDHHGEEIPHDPLEYHGEGQEDGAGEEEYPAKRRRVSQRGRTVRHQGKGGGGSRYRRQSGRAAPAHQYHAECGRGYAEAVFSTYPSAKAFSSSLSSFYRPNAYPTNPRAVGFANLLL